MIQPHATGGHFHAVGFYKDSVSLCDVVGRFLAEGFVAGQPGIAIATPEHRPRIAQRLASLGHDPAVLVARGDLVLVDAQSLLARIVVEGMPRARLFRTAMAPILRGVSAGPRRRSVRAYGEMVDLLWKSGQPAAALRLETFWNQLAGRREFSLLCGYHVANAYPNSAVERICAKHTHVLSEPLTTTAHC